MSFLKSVPDTWETLLPIDGTAQVPMAHVALPAGNSTLCQIDTGCLGLAGLNHQVFDALESREILLPLGKSYGIDLCRTAEARTALLPSIGFGNFQSPPAVVGELDGMNLLGLRFWSRFNVTFDFPQRAMYLQRNSNFELAEGADRSGLHMFRRRGEFIVDRIDQGSPADVAGIEPLDHLLIVEKQPAATLTLPSLRKLLCVPGKKLRLTVRRGERQLAAMLELAGDVQGPPPPFQRARK
ncbi:MAG TPA: PDZ domain-containing protein [Pirellulales bacterium]|nr:PDZ domain-containing protein [Pirellulales bacterium]